MSDESLNFEVGETLVITEFGWAILSDGQYRTLKAVTSAGPIDEIVVTGVDRDAGTITISGGAPARKNERKRRNRRAGR